MLNPIIYMIISLRVELVCSWYRLWHFELNLVEQHSRVVTVSNIFVMKFFFFWFEFNRNCYLQVVSIVSSRYQSRYVYASWDPHEWTDFCVQWPMILLVDYREIFANLQTQPIFLELRMGHSSEFDDSLLHGFLNWNKKIILNLFFFKYLKRKCWNK